jgi:hypothetical protein
MRFSAQLKGSRKLMRQIDQLGKVPQRAVQLAARKGAVFAQRTAKSQAPVDTGTLRTAIKVFGEKRQKMGKKVYMVVFDYAYNKVFQKFNKKAQAEIDAGKKGVQPTAYYPASQEYGWVTKTGRKIAGKYFLRDSVANHRPQIQKLMLDVLEKQVDKAANR